MKIEVVNKFLVCSLELPHGLLHHRRLYISQLMRVLPIVDPDHPLCPNKCDVYALLTGSPSTSDLP